MKAIIGGTGVYSLEGVFESIEEVSVFTEYGEIDVDIATLSDGERIVFLARHGKNHSCPPHKVNYRGNIFALKKLGVSHVFATCAVGSISKDIKPGELTIITDFIDQTKSRSLTFYDGDNGVKHVEMSDPYCNYLRSEFYDYAIKNKIKVKKESIYVCTEGPRFETAAEIKFYSQIGGDVVGMTNVPEVVLAKELGIHYAAIGIVTNWCTGVVNSDISGHEIMESMNINREILTKSFVEILSKRDLENSQICTCENSLIEL